MNIEIGEPVVVATSEADYLHWGPYQFPRLNRLPDGRILISYHVEADSPTAYGLSKGMAISADNGNTWTQVADSREAMSDVNFVESVLLPNGDHVRPFAPRSIPVEELTLPERTVFSGIGGYGHETKIYLQEEIPELRGKGWELLRLPKGGTAWVKEQAHVSLPGLCCVMREGVIPVPRFDVLKVAPDGSLWSLEYRFPRFLDGKLTFRSILILRSADHGKNWEIWSEILYQPDIKTDPLAEERINGYGEPDVEFLPDGSVLMLLRTTDGKGPGPLYAVRSTDLGRTWSDPEFFDNIGVWPQLLTLANGITLATYGRPGFFLRATDDPSARIWQEKITIVEPKAEYYDTCSYSAMLPLDANTVLLAHSDFHHRGADGKQRKAIMVRRVSILSR